MAWFRRNFAYWFTLFVVLVLVAWPGRIMYYKHLTAKEAERIAAITPSQVADHAPQRLRNEQLMADVRWLAAPERQGRLAGSPEGDATRQYIVQRFQELGLEPGGTEGYLHPFSTERSGTTANVIGIIPGNESKKGKPLRTIVVTAHYDHLGARDGKIYHGADDNASGTAALLEFARFLMQYPNRHPIALMALDHEENGLKGARALFTTNLLNPKEVAFNINMDMISRDTQQTLFAVGTYHNPWLVPLLQRVQQESAVKLILAHDRPARKAGYTPDWTFSSDHGPFHEQGIPFLYFGVADHADYHQPTDTADRVNELFFHAAAEASLSSLLLIDRVLAEKL